MCMGQLQKVSDQTGVIDRNFLLKYMKFTKILLFLDLKLESRNQCPIRRKWPLQSSRF